MRSGGGGTHSWHIAPGGQRLRLNDTNDGIIIERMGKYGMERFAVALAASRGKASWLNSETNVPGMTSYPDLKNLSTLKAGMSDAAINAQGVPDTGTAKYNTDLLIAAGSQAAQFCRSKKIGGMVCNLPTLTQLQLCWVLKTEINTIDYTVAANPSMDMDVFNFDNSNGAWSNLEYGISHAWSIRAGGYYPPVGKKTAQMGVIPIVELS